MKTCTNCGEPKQIACFARDRTKKDGHEARCKKCKNEKANVKNAVPLVREERRLKSLAWYRNNPEKARHIARESYRRNPESRKAAVREYRRRNPAQTHKNHIQARYGLTPEQFSELLTQQNGGCGICGAQPSGKTKRLCVDHDHATGAVRGLLCAKHNRAIGLFDDDQDLLLKAIVYLKKGGAGPMAVAA